MSSLANVMSPNSTQSRSRSFCPAKRAIRSTPSAKSAGKTTAIDASAFTRRVFASVSIRKTVKSPTLAAPSTTGTADTECVSRNATTIPGRTAWLTASPTSDMPRSSRNVPSTPHATAANAPVRSVTST